MTEQHLELGSITITYELDPDGDIQTGVTVDGDIPYVVQLGLLRLAEDTILCMGEDEDDDE